MERQAPGNGCLATVHFREKCPNAEGSAQRTDGRWAEPKHIDWSDWDRRGKLDFSLFQVFMLEAIKLLHLFRKDIQRASVNVLTELV